MDNLEEYTDPIEYDCEYGDPEPEFSFYSKFAKKSGNPILEIACGTGRIAIPLASQGFQITGIDISKAMIERAIQKTKGTSIELIVADGRTFELGKLFRMIYMTGNAFQALLARADQEMLLQNVRKHLLPDGIFVFDTRFPLLSELSSTSKEEEYWHSYKNPEGQSVKVSGYHIYDGITQIAEYITFRRWQVNGQIKTRKTKIALRYTFPMEMEALLHYNGFSIEQLLGDWNGTPFNSIHEKMIYVCKLI